MSSTLEPLILDLVEWVATEPRPYTVVLDAWRTSCPRLPVWEEAVERGLVTRQLVQRGVPMVAATPAGLNLLRKVGRG